MEATTMYCICVMVCILNPACPLFLLVEGINSAHFPLSNIGNLWRGQKHGLPSSSHIGLQQSNPRLRDADKSMQGETRKTSYAQQRDIRNSHIQGQNAKQNVDTNRQNSNEKRNVDTNRQSSNEKRNVDMQNPSSRVRQNVDIHYSNRENIRNVDLQRQKRDNRRKKGEHGPNIEISRHAGQHQQYINTKRNVHVQKQNGDLTGAHRDTRKGVHQQNRNSNQSEDAQKRFAGLQRKSESTRQSVVIQKEAEDATRNLDIQQNREATQSAHVKQNRRNAHLHKQSNEVRRQNLQMRQAQTQNPNVRQTQTYNSVYGYDNQKNRNARERQKQRNGFRNMQANNRDISQIEDKRNRDLKEVVATGQSQKQYIAVDLDTKKQNRHRKLTAGQADNTSPSTNVEQNREMKQKFDARYLQKQNREAKHTQKQITNTLKQDIGIKQIEKQNEDTRVQNTDTEHLVAILTAHEDYPEPIGNFDLKQLDDGIRALRHQKQELQRKKRAQLRIARNTHRQERDLKPQQDLNKNSRDLCYQQDCIKCTQTDCEECKVAIVYETRDCLSSEQQCNGYMRDSDSHYHMEGYYGRICTEQKTRPYANHSPPPSSPSQSRPPSHTPLIPTRPSIRPNPNPPGYLTTASCERRGGYIFDSRRTCCVTSATRHIDDGESYGECCLPAPECVKDYFGICMSPWDNTCSTPTHSDKCPGEKQCCIPSNPCEKHGGICIELDGHCEKQYKQKGMCGDRTKVCCIDNICGRKARGLACDILNNRHIHLYDEMNVYIPNGAANPTENLQDMCQGKRSQTCKEECPNEYTCVSVKILMFLDCISNIIGDITVLGLAGDCRDTHCNSQCNGRGVNLLVPPGSNVRQLENICEDMEMSATVVYAHQGEIDYFNCSF